MAARGSTRVAKKKVRRVIGVAAARTLICRSVQCVCREKWARGGRKRKGDRVMMMVIDDVCARVRALRKQTNKEACARVRVRVRLFSARARERERERESERATKNK